MHYTTEVSSAANTVTVGECHLSLQALLTAFARLPDPRRGPNLGYSLAAMLLAALLGLLCNQLSQLAIAHWLADQPPALKRLLGFEGDTTPPQTTFNRLFQKLQAASLETALSQTMAKANPARKPKRGAEAVAIDGKCQRTREELNLRSSRKAHLAICLVCSRTS